MHRRKLLKSVAALPLLALAPPLIAAAPAPLRRVRPGDPAWPNAADWRALDEAVGGALLEVRSLFSACASDGGSVGCRDVLANIENPFYIGDQPAGTQVSGWLDAWTPAPSAYAVKARNSADVAAAINFARQRQLRLAVKGGGHSYQGTSSAPDSLLIWLRAMNQVTVHDAFVPAGCAGKVSPVPAVSAGAGAMWIDLYDAVTTRGGRYVQGGGCTTVGVAGLVQSGGFGSFSKGFGSAAAGLLEAEIVTADGRVRTVNACTEPDLYWALKGGGGGSWGVLTRLTLRTHELPEFMGAAWGKLRAQSDDAFRRLLDRFFEFYATNLYNPHWGEQVRIGSDNTLEISMVCQGLDPQQAQQTWQPFFAWISAARFHHTRQARCRRQAGAPLVGYRRQPLHDQGQARRRPCAPRLVGGRPGTGGRLPSRLRLAVAAGLAARVQRAIAAQRGALRRKPQPGDRAAFQQGPGRGSHPRDRGDARHRHEPGGDQRLCARDHGQWRGAVVPGNGTHIRG